MSPCFLFYFLENFDVPFKVIFNFVDKEKTSKKKAGKSALFFNFRIL